MSGKPCERCRSLAIPGLRFCGNHLSLIKYEMMKSGYLQYVPPRSDRPKNAQEHTYETKYGSDSQS
jgi:hypothetical protein